MINDKNTYYLDKKEKQYFITCLLLEAILNHRKRFKLLNFNDDNSYLEEYFIDMISNGYIKISENDEFFEVTSSGRKLYKNFNTKLDDFRSFYKIYSAVDTGEGEFAFESFYDFDTDKEFENYLNDERFEDLRVALCQYKDINPLEIVFLDLVEENRFDLSSRGWQFELTSGLIWDELVDIVNSNIKVEDLAEADEYTGNQVMEMIIERGSEVYNNLLEVENDSPMVEKTWENKYY